MIFLLAKATGTKYYCKAGVTRVFWFGATFRRKPNAKSQEFSPTVRRGKLRLLLAALSTTTLFLPTILQTRDTSST